jgi:hypothetical protein
MYDDDWGIDGSSILDRITGRPRMLAEQCSTCIFWPGNRMQLRAGRLRDMVESARRADSFIVCHQTLPGGREQPAVCRGFADRFSTNFLRIMERLGGWHEVPAAACADGGAS